MSCLVQTGEFSVSEMSALREGCRGLLHLYEEQQAPGGRRDTPSDNASHTVFISEIRFHRSVAGPLGATREHFTDTIATPPTA